MKRITYALVLLALPAVVIAGCGGDDDNGGGGYGGGSTSGSESSGGYGGGNTSPSSESGGGAGVVTVAQVDDLGSILVDSEGRTLYDFHKDKGTSTCYGACAQTWPPLLTEGEPQAKGGASTGMLGTTKRNDGTVQVTYAGHPLYTFTGDKKPGEANGNDVDAFGAEWYALQPNGQEPED